MFPMASVLQVSPLFHAMGFDVTNIDHRGHKIFSATSRGIHDIGPAGNQRKYHQPADFARIGLSVLGAYPSDEWLHPFKHTNNWYRGYHGTGRFGANVFSAIVNNGFTPSTSGKLGPGIYVSPHVEYAERYSKALRIVTTQGNKQYKCIFQLCVAPGSIVREGYPGRLHANYGTENSEWVIQDSNSVRPYGILVKEV